MYSNDTTQIRQGFTNYIGALVMSMKLPEKGAKQEIVNILVNEIFDISENNGLTDLYIIRPFIIGINRFLKERITEIEKVEVKTQSMKDTLSDYNQIVEFFTTMLSTMNNN